MNEMNKVKEVKKLIFENFDINFFKQKVIDVTLSDHILADKKRPFVSSQYCAFIIGLNFLKHLEEIISKSDSKDLLSIFSDMNVFNLCFINYLFKKDTIYDTLNKFEIHKENENTFHRLKNNEKVIKDIIEQIFIKSIKFLIGNNKLNSDFKFDKIDLFPVLENRLDIVKNLSLFIVKYLFKTNNIENIILSKENNIFNNEKKVIKSYFLNFFNITLNDHIEKINNLKKQLKLNKSKLDNNEIDYNESYSHLNKNGTTLQLRINAEKKDFYKFYVSYKLTFLIFCLDIDLPSYDSLKI